MVGNSIRIECSIDSLNWKGGFETLLTDSIYTSGTTQLVWGSWKRK